MRCMICLMCLLRTKAWLCWNVESVRMMWLEDERMVSVRTVCSTELRWGWWRLDRAQWVRLCWCWLVMREREMSDDDSVWRGWHWQLVRSSDQGWDQWTQSQPWSHIRHWSSSSSSKSSSSWCCNKWLWWWYFSLSNSYGGDHDDEMFGFFHSRSKIIQVQEENLFNKIQEQLCSTLTVVHATVMTFFIIVNDCINYWAISRGILQWEDEIILVFKSVSSISLTLAYHLHYLLGIRNTCMYSV